MIAIHNVTRHLTIGAFAWIAVAFVTGIVALRADRWQLAAPMAVASAGPLVFAAFSVYLIWRSRRRTRAARA
jgi:membrane protein DedA with SNARE-associated domain